MYGVLLPRSICFLRLRDLGWSLHVAWLFLLPGVGHLLAIARQLAPARPANLGCAPEKCEQAKRYSAAPAAGCLKTLFAPTP
jgi:hypothetical protein